MRVRCPKCSSINVYPDEKGWRRTQCPICSHGFVATKALVVDDDSSSGETASSRRDGSAEPVRAASGGGGGFPRHAALAVAAVAVIGAGLATRQWLATRIELRKLRSEVSHLSATVLPEHGGPTTPGDAPDAETDPADHIDSLKKKIEAGRMLAKLQEEMIAKMRAVNEMLEGRVDRLEAEIKNYDDALRREKEAHGNSRDRLAGLVKENAALRRDIDARLRQIRSLEMELTRGR